MGLGTELPAAGGQLGFGGRRPNAAAIFQYFSKKYSNFMHIFV